MEVLINDFVLNYYPFKIIKYQTKKFLYVSTTGSIFEIDDLTTSLLENEKKSSNDVYELVKNNCSKEKFDELINQMIESCILKTEETKKIVNKKQSSNNKISSLILLVVQECNLSCTYCYGNDGEYENKGKMSLKLGQKSIDYLMENSADLKDVSIVFFGGEPLLNFQLIKELVTYAKEVGDIYHKNIIFSMTSNGTLLTEEINEFLENNKFSLTISMDGDKETHDKNRLYSTNKGSYDKVVKDTAGLRDKTNITARATISKAQLDVVKTFNHLNSLKFSKIALAPSVDILDANDFEILKKTFSALVNEYEILINNKQYNKARRMTNVSKIISRVHSGGMRKYFCGAGKNMLAIDIDGNIYPCHRFVGENNYRVGNVIDGLNNNKYEEKMNEFSIDSHFECNDCWAKCICGGGCPQENLVTMKSTMKPNNTICEFYKCFYEEVINLYISMNDEQKEALGLTFEEN
ncbi:PapB family radical SAM/SPASM ranthipeptide maturase [Clostridium algidicarnis]|uniref:PapB family radical SAM/SPASM ranthipeptide maturase n=1 Tax=Clostridium algidicarnis TaxID=37659 RepID=UPI00162494FF|nr:SPASM domain-containing protein [Clostridium algidicarnis]MBB6698711.1 SPASM domain-containing protein [Clostridium algidicarnis]